MYVYTTNNPNTVTWTTPSHWQRIISGITVTLYGTTLEDPYLPFYDQISATYLGVTVSRHIAIDECEILPGTPEVFAAKERGYISASNDKHAMNVELYNNPSKDGRFSLYKSNTRVVSSESYQSEYDVVVIDAVGAEVYKGLMNEDLVKYQLDVVPGIYFVIISSKDSIDNPINIHKIVILE